MKAIDEMKAAANRLDALQDACKAVGELERGMLWAFTAADREVLRYHVEGVDAVVSPRFPFLQPRIQVIRAKLG